MDNSQRKKKQFIITGIYIIILVIFVWLAYLWLRTEETCADKIQNQNEEGIDCGGICPLKCEKIEVENLKVESSGFVDSGIAGKVDLYSEVSNPNHSFGSSEFVYLFEVKDISGETLLQRRGVSFILPGEKKYIIENNVDFPAGSQRLAFSIQGATWQEFNDYYEKPDLKVTNKTYNEIVSGVGFSEAKGLLKNVSPFDFSLIRINVVAFDENGKILALNGTEMRTVKSMEEREFRVFWPQRFPGNVARVEFYPEVNVFNSDSFAKTNFKTQKFQKNY